MNDKDNKDTQIGDEALGLNNNISRRDFLNTTLLASGGALLNSVSPMDILGPTGVPETDEEWYGPGGVGDYSRTHGNSPEARDQGHKVRDGVFDTLPADTIDTGEIYDLVVVGGGISGLSAALFFKDQAGPGRNCLVLDNHQVFGGEAKRNEFIVEGQRLMAAQGPIEVCIPFPGSIFDLFYRRVGFNFWDFKYQRWDGHGPEMPLSRWIYQQLGRMPATYGLYFGARFGKQPGMWLVDPWGKNLEGAPFEPEIRADLLKLRKADSTDVERNSVWEPKFEGDDISRRLDSMTIEEHYSKVYGVSRDTVRMWYVIVPEGLGLGPDVISAYGEHSWGLVKDCGEKGDNMAPGGLADLARHIVKTLVDDAIPGPRTLENVCKNSINFAALDRKESPTRIRLGAPVIRVEHGEYPGTYPGRSSFVWITYTQNGKTYRLKGRTVIMAGGGWITKHVVRDLPPSYREAYDQFHYAPNLRVNVAFRNWRFMHKLGIAGARWFEGFGSFTEVRTVPTIGTDSETIGPDSPIVLSFPKNFMYPGLPIDDQTKRGRYELLSTPFRDYERQIRATLTDMFSGSGFDANRDIAGIVLNRWGHALLAPQPGFFFGKDGNAPPRDIIRARPVGRIAFSHTDLGGSSDHQHSILESSRAVRQVLDVLF